MHQRDGDERASNEPSYVLHTSVPPPAAYLSQNPAPIYCERYLIGSRPASPVPFSTSWAILVAPAKTPFAIRPSANSRFSVCCAVSSLTARIVAILRNHPLAVNHFVTGGDVSATNLLKLDHARVPGLYGILLFREVSTHIAHRKRYKKISTYTFFGCTFRVSQFLPTVRHQRQDSPR